MSFAISAISDILDPHREVAENSILILKIFYFFIKSIDLVLIVGDGRDLQVQRTDSVLQVPAIFLAISQLLSGFIYQSNLSIKVNLELISLVVGCSEGCVILLGSS